MFNIVEGKGFHVTFDNGYTVSVQFGPGNYGDNRYAPRGAERECGIMGSRTAEVAVWDRLGTILFDDQLEKGYVSPEDVAKLLYDISRLPERRA